VRAAGGEEITMDQDVSGTAPADRPDPTDSVRMQILATEHWSLLATRSMVWNEMFTRAGMFLTTLSASIVALALVAQASAFDETFRMLALLILPVVLFLGLATSVRLGHAQVMDTWSVAGMNRLRHAYLDIAPDLEPYFVTSHHDDIPGLLWTSGHFDRIKPSMALVSTPAIVDVICAVLSGVIGWLLMSLVTDQEAARMCVAVVIGLVMAVLLLVVAPQMLIREHLMTYEPRFPCPEKEG
jgi:hypothetical protein